MYGIKETKELVKFGIDMAESFDKALGDGSFSLEDLSFFFNAFISASAAFENIGQVPTELKDLSAEEMAELKEYVNTEFDIANDKLEAVIEKAIAVVIGIYELISLFKGGFRESDEPVVE